MQSVEEIKQQLEKTAGCDLPVWDCTETKQIIQCPNTYRTDFYGVWQYKPQCLKCGRIGKAKSQRPTPNGLRIISLDEAKAFEQEKRQARKRLWGVYSDAHDRAIAEEKAQWRAAYENYLKTPQWFKKRDRVLKRDKQLCQACLIHPATQVHHLSYKFLGDEPLFHLTSVCSNCHERLHRKENNNA
jgi:5-methylcytosine-specific restriction endonuclease McrA